MENLKSQGVSPTCLLISLLEDMYEQAPPGLRTPDWRAQLKRDINTVKVRVASEGLGFLTKQLAQLSKWVLQLCEGLPLCSLPFQIGGNGFPRFLGGLTGKLSTENWGDDPDAYWVVYSFRQVAHLFYKAEATPTADQIRAAEGKYLGIEEEIRDWDAKGSIRFASGVFSTARALVHRVLGEYSHTRFDRHVPRHGPGAVSEGWRGNRKFDVCRDARLAVAFPPGRFSQTLGTITRREQIPSTFSPAYSRLLLVPKDSRGPRSICAEPAWHQWHQQYLLRCLEEVIPRETKGRVQFSDQNVNGRLALLSSSSRAFATLDMSDASDRVPASLVEYLVPPSWWSVLSACRTTHTVLPSGRLLRLRKFASMGSAVCFPIEALVFWALLVASTGSSSAQELTTYVFGDDILVRRSVAVHAMRVIQELTPLRFSREKCFVAGRFRESCGVDAYAGEVVTPLRWKHSMSSCSLDKHDVIRFGNESYKHGLWRLAATCAKVDAPVLSFGACGPAIAHQTAQACIPMGVRWSRARQAFEVKVDVEVGLRQHSGFVSPEGRLMKALIRREACENSLACFPLTGGDAEQVVLPRRTKIHRRWKVLSVPIYRARGAL